MARMFRTPPAADQRGDRSRRQRLERSWIVLVIAWSGLRIVAVWHWLEQYGVHPVVYALVDLGSSVPYAIASARTIGALIDRRYRHAARWGLLAATCYVAPDVYIVTAGQQMPWAVYAVVVTVALAAGVLALWAGRNEVADARGRSVAPTGGVAALSGVDHRPTQ
jgi:hypothetical protein